MVSTLFISNNPYVFTSGYTTSFNSTTKAQIVNQSGVRIFIKTNEAYTRKGVYYRVYKEERKR